MNKYTLKEKRRRNQAIMIYKINNPDVTLHEMKNIFGISRQRISAIMKQAENKKEGG